MHDSEIRTFAEIAPPASSLLNERHGFLPQSRSRPPAESSSSSHHANPCRVHRLGAPACPPPTRPPCRYLRLRDSGNQAFAVSPRKGSQRIQAPSDSARPARIVGAGRGLPVGSHQRSLSAWIRSLISGWTVALDWRRRSIARARDIEDHVMQQASLAVEGEWLQLVGWEYIGRRDGLFVS